MIGLIGAARNGKFIDRLSLIDGKELIEHIENGLIFFLLSTFHVLGIQRIRDIHNL